MTLPEADRSTPMATLRKFMISLAITVGLIYLLLAVLLLVFQRSLLYHPTPMLTHDFDESVINSGDTQIRVITINPGQTKALLYFGGNAEAVVMNGPDFQRTLPDVTVYLVNYRGYGGSAGSPSESGLFEDALAVFDTVVNDHGSISVLGRSLGSGVASYVAASRDVAGVVLVTPYDSIRNLAQSLYPMFPADLILQDHFDSIGRVPQISEPVLVLMAERDAVTPERFTENLVQAFPVEQVTFHSLPGTNHNSISSASNYYSLIAEFLRSLQ